MKIFKGRVGLVMLLIILGAAYYIFFSPSPEVKQAPSPEEKHAAPVPPPSSHRDRPPAKKTITIIIDDIGYSLLPLEELLKIEAPLAFAILPYAPHAGAAAAMIRKRGGKREILLHLPLEPHDPKQSPGPGALFCDMTDSEIKARLEEDLASVPDAVGVNNHMGSAFMEDEARLYLVLKELQKRGLFFIDSRTSAASRAEAAALKAGIPFAARKLFLDNDPTQEIIFNNLLGHVEKNKGLSLIVIGHPYPGTVRALQEAVPLLRAGGIKIVPPSGIVSAAEDKTLTKDFN